MENLRRVLTAIFFRENLLQSSRFGEGLRLAKDRLNEKNNIYFINPSFDK